MFYKFHCNACNKDIELNLKVADLPNAVCCECGSGDLDKKFKLNNYKITIDKQMI